MKKISVGLSKVMGTGTSLTKNEIKDFMEVIRSLENKEMLLKEISRNVSCQEKELISFTAPLTRVALPLMKNVLKS